MNDTDSSEAAGETSGSCGSNLTWTYDTETHTLTINGSGDMTYFGINDTKWGGNVIDSVSLSSGVTSIGSYAFSGCSSLTSVIIGNSVTSIGEGAFLRCTSLTAITIPDSITSIGKYAFAGCTSLDSITIGNSVTSIGTAAFSGCTSLTAITIPDSTTSIGDYAFDGCTSLDSVTIGNSVTLIGEFAFNGCTGLTKLTIPISLNAVTSNPHPAFYGCTNIKEVIFTPGTGTGFSYVTSSAATYRPSYIFSYEQTPWFLSRANLTSITISDGVISIGDYTFNGCTSLDTVIIGNSLTSVGLRAFVGCNSLTSVTTNSPTVDSWFRGMTSITTVTVGDSVSSIGDYAFDGCTSLDTVIIGNSVTSIGEFAFRGCTSLTAITIPDSVTSIGSSIFDGCTSLMSVNINCPKVGSWLRGITSLTSITIGDMVTSIETSAFDGCTSLTAINVGEWNTVYYSENGALFNNSKSQLIKYPMGKVDSTYTIPSSVTSIGSSAFDGCTSLDTVIIGNPLTSVGNNAFHGCTSLTAISLPDSVTSIGSSAFDGCTSLDTVIIGNSVTSIGEYAFRGCTSLTAITLPDSVTSIGSSAFDGCTSLDTVIIGNSVTSIGEFAFRGCTSLVTITIPDLVSFIGIYAFYGCSSLTAINVDEKNTFYSSQDGVLFDVSKTQLIHYPAGKTDSYTVPNSVTSIRTYAFYGCSSLTSITIPNSVTTIGNYAFSGCSSLTSITIPDSVTSIGYYAFSGCTGLTKLTLPISLNAVVSNSSPAFYGCTNISEVIFTPGTGWGFSYQSNLSYYDGYYYTNTPWYISRANLTSINICDSVTSIGSYAFYGCTSLTSITIPDSVTSIGSNAFYGCTSLTSITIPDSVTSIGSYAFYGCTGLTRLTLPISLNAVTSNSSPAFSGCNNIREVVFTTGTGAGFSYGTDSSPYGYNYYQNTPWYISRTNLTSITISDSVTSIGNNAFRGCTELRELLYISDSIKTIGDYAFQGCSGISEISFGNGIVIGNGAFSFPQTTCTVYCRGAMFTLPADAVSDRTVFKYVKICTVTFTTGDLVFKQLYETGETIVAPDIPSTWKSGDITYTFNGWMDFEEGMLASRDMTIVALISTKATSYTVDSNGSAAVDADRYNAMVLDKGIIDETKKAVSEGTIDSLKIVLSNGKISISGASLSSIQINGDVPVSIDDVSVNYSGTSLSGSSVYDISFGNVKQFGENGLTVTLPYTLGKGQDVSKLEVWCVDNLDSVEKLSCTYDVNAHTVTFVTSHLSDYAIVYVEPESEPSNNLPMAHISIGVVVMLAIVGGAIILIRKR